MRWILPMAVMLVVGMTTNAATAQQYATQTFEGHANAEKALTYAEAYSLAKSGDKPMLIMVTAEWCPPCQVMKANTLPLLMQKNTFGNFHFAMIDYDSDSELAKQLIGDRGLPQLIMYEKSDGKWLRRYINGQKGIHSVEKVESFVAQAGTVRLASKADEASDKK